MSSKNSNSSQKTFYPSEDVGRWIEKVANESDRSESYIISKVMEELADSAEYDEIRLQDVLSMVNNGEL